MSSEKDNVQVVKQVYTAFGRGDMLAILEMLTDDVEWSVPGSPEVLPWAGQRRGREQVGQFFQAVGGTLEFETFEPQQFIAQGEAVVVLGTERVRASGRVVETDWAMVFTIRDGKIARFRDYHDTAPIQAALRGA